MAVAWLHLDTGLSGLFCRLFVFEKVGVDQVFGDGIVASCQGHFRMRRRWSQLKLSVCV